MTVSAPQLGKTVALGLWLIIGAWRDAEAGISLPSWWTAPTFGMAEQGTEKLVEMARSADLLRSERSKPYPRIGLINGGLIEARSWDQPETLFGPTVARIAVDEFGWLTAEAHAALRSRVSETRTRGLGYMRYAGNVGEIGGEAEALWTHAVSTAGGWAARTWTWRDRAAAGRCECGLNGDGLEIEHAPLHRMNCERGRYLAELSDLRMRMSDAHFRQLYGAEWLDWSSLPAYTFDRAVHVSADVTLDPHLPLGIAFDFNVDPMAVTIGQYLGREAWTADEVAIEGGATTDAACREVERRFPKGWNAGVVIYGDASGKARKTSASQTDYQIIETRFRAHFGEAKVRSAVPSANPAVSDRLNAVNALLDNRRWSVHPRCVNLIADRTRVSLKPGTRDLDKSDKRRTHFSDSDDYRLVAEFPVRPDGPMVTIQSVAMRRARKDPIMDMVS